MASGSWVAKRNFQEIEKDNEVEFCYKIKKKLRELQKAEREREAEAGRHKHSHQETKRGASCEERRETRRHRNYQATYNDNPYRSKATRDTLDVHWIINEREERTSYTPPLQKEEWSSKEGGETRELRGHSGTRELTSETRLRQKLKRRAASPPTTPSPWQHKSESSEARIGGEKEERRRGEKCQERTHDEEGNGRESDSEDSRLLTTQSTKSPWQRRRLKMRGKKGTPTDGHGLLKNVSNATMGGWRQLEREQRAERRAPASQSSEDNCSSPQRRNAHKGKPQNTIQRRAPQDAHVTRWAGEDATTHNNQLSLGTTTCYLSTADKSPPKRKNKKKAKTLPAKEELVFVVKKRNNKDCLVCERGPDESNIMIETKPLKRKKEKKERVNINGVEMMCKRKVVNKKEVFVCSRGSKSNITLVLNAYKPPKEKKKEGDEPSKKEGKKEKKRKKEEEERGKGKKEKGKDKEKAEEGKKEKKKKKEEKEKKEEGEEPSKKEGKKEKKRNKKEDKEEEERGKGKKEKGKDKEKAEKGKKAGEKHKEEERALKEGKKENKKMGVKWTFGGKTNGKVSETLTFWQRCIPLWPTYHVAKCCHNSGQQEREPIEVKVTEVPNCPKTCTIEYTNDGDAPRTTCFACTSKKKECVFRDISPLRITGGSCRYPCKTCQVCIHQKTQVFYKFCTKMKRCFIVGPIME